MTRTKLFHKKYQCVRQLDQSDCGAASLATIAKHYGRTVPINRIREKIGTGRQGTSLLGLKQGAQAMGFDTRAGRGSDNFVDNLHSAPLPLIIHWKGAHYVVLFGKRRNRFVIADPSVGIRYLTKKELLSGWSNRVMLLLHPDESEFFAKQDEKQSGIGRFLVRVVSYRGLLLQVLICSLTAGLLSLASPLLLQILTDDVLVRGDTKLLIGVVSAVVLMTLFSSFLQLGQSTLIAHFAKRLELGLMVEFVKKLLNLPLGYYESHRSGEVVSRLRDIEEINGLVSQVSIGLPTRTFVSIVSTSLMLYYSWKLTIASIGMSIVMSFSTVLFLPMLRRKTREMMILEAENQGILVETFKGALTLKTTNANSALFEELQGRFTKLTRILLDTAQLGIVNSLFSQIVAGLGGVFLLAFGSGLVIAKELTIGQLLAFNSMNGNFIALITTLIGLTDQLARAQTAIQRITDVIDSNTDNKDDALKSFSLISSDADIVCNNVNYHYADRSDLLEDFSLKIPGATATALIGKSGCGKSTISKIIAGLYTFQSGNIRIGDYNLQDLPIDCVRQQIVLVPQDAHFWSRSIVDNFRLGSCFVSFEDIVRACKMTGADEFISQMPDKYQTVLGEFGATISGGQRQRLAIARAIVTNPPILILDESTSGLDPESEAVMLDMLLNYRQGKTTIMVSHRPRVINRASWIIFPEKGKLAASGTLDTLRETDENLLHFLNP